MAHTTNPTLLERLKTGEDPAWEKFLEFYKPLILYVGREYGLTEPADQRELTQEVLLKFFRQQQKFVYDRTKGKFRTYLGLIISQCARDIQRKKQNGIVFDEMVQTPQNEGLSWDHDKIWNRASAKFILFKALQELRTQVDEVTYQAYVLHGMNGIPARKVGVYLSLTQNQVSQKKNKCLDALRKIIEEFEETW